MFEFKNSLFTIQKDGLEMIWTPCLEIDGKKMATSEMKEIGRNQISFSFEDRLFWRFKFQEEGESLLEKAEEYLNAHGIVNVNKDWLKGDVIDIIKSNYYDKMDGFVVGAHARSGVFDFLVGSLTKFLVRKAEKLVFIGQ